MESALFEPNSDFRRKPNSGENEYKQNDLSGIIEDSAGRKPNSLSNVDRHTITTNNNTHSNNNNDNYNSNSTNHNDNDNIYNNNSNNNNTINKNINGSEKRLTSRQWFYEDQQRFIDFIMILIDQLTWTDHLNFTYALKLLRENYNYPFVDSKTLKHRYNELISNYYQKQHTHETLTEIDHKVGLFLQKKHQSDLKRSKKSIPAANDSKNATESYNGVVTAQKPSLNKTSHGIPKNNDSSAITAYNPQYQSSLLHKFKVSKTSSPNTNKTSNYNNIMPTNVKAASALSSSPSPSSPSPASFPSASVAAFNTPSDFVSKIDNLEESLNGVVKIIENNSTIEELKWDQYLKKEENNNITLNNLVKEIININQLISQESRDIKDGMKQLSEELNSIGRRISNLEEERARERGDR
ncbi:uncharacterized protein SCDLUD_004000 [Saccharomycodes ludwigii]|uniref:uncharacterized protein n=1 Tax=Saccharomycodes ludwigii TaxID=36035 RepID=UPI001E86C587|nr:hypothetical protein SCDLUD_004000 [Saccharomycodes ludwigii]KAH3899714.1 hypothetical protein SCDLUD_004000 [Saccharomycodes ludwigii]